MDTLLYSWTFSDVKNRGKMWYIIATSIVIGIAVWGILFQQYLLTFVILLVSGVLLIVENNSSDMVEIKITELGIKVQEDFYEFSRISGFNFIYYGEQPVYVNIFIEKRGFKSIKLNIDNEVFTNVKDILPNFIPEGQSAELSKSEKLINFLKL